MCITGVAVHEGCCHDGSSLQAEVFGPVHGGVVAPDDRTDRLYPLYAGQQFLEHDPDLQPCQPCAQTMVDAAAEADAVGESRAAVR